MLRPIGALPIETGELGGERGQHVLERELDLTFVVTSSLLPRFRRLVHTAGIPDRKGTAMGFAIKRVGHLVLSARDIRRSRQFFEQVLGLPVVAENERGMVFFSTNVKDNHHMLALMPAREGAAMPTADQVGMQHVSFELGSFAELQDAWRALRKHGVPIDHTVYHGITKSIYFYDPDGNRLELYCNVPEEEYRKSAPQPYSRYNSIEDELEGSTPQREGTVAP
jgi:catechol 2,3-dioxygenase